jgi:hypothetical protein
MSPPQGTCKCTSEIAKFESFREIVGGWGSSNISNALNMYAIDGVGIRIIFYSGLRRCGLQRMNMMSLDQQSFTESASKEAIQLTSRSFRHIVR